MGAFTNIVAANDVTIIEERNHLDMGVYDAVRNELKDAAQKGVKHLFLEHDPLMVAKEEVLQAPDAYGQMARMAESLGIQIHFYDDRPYARAANEKYPEEANIQMQSDMYVENPETLIAQAPDPDRMKLYLDERNPLDPEKIQYRNTRMIANIADVMDKHPGEKALVMTGFLHVSGTDDLDEGLRSRGLRTATLDIITAATPKESTREISSASKDAPKTHAQKDALRAEDKPDFIIDATGQLLFHKIPGTNDLQFSNPTNPDQVLPWGNAEQVTNISGMQAAMAAARAVDCSWNNPQKTTSCGPEITGTLAVPSGPANNNELDFGAINGR